MIGRKTMKYGKKNTDPSLIRRKGVMSNRGESFTGTIAGLKKMTVR
jgi:hypothetical protein